MANNLHPLRDYQARAVAKTLRLEREGGRGICIQSPTGSGKSRVVAQFLIDGTPQILLTHRRPLLDQMASVLTSYGIPFGFRANGRSTNFKAPIQLGMVQSEYNNAHKKDKWPLHPAKRLFIDEIHTVTAAMASTIVNRYKQQGATFVGTTATPVEIHHLCDNVVVAATIQQLVDAKVLAPAVVFTPDGPGLEKLESVDRQSNGEFSPTKLKKVWNATTVFGRVVEHYNTLNPERKPAVLFAQSVADSLWFAKRLTEKGIRAAHVDGDTVWCDGEQMTSDSRARSYIFAGLADGSIQCLCNRYVLREGWDCPAVSHVILACAFGARHNFMQAIGRGQRMAPGKENYIIQDHAGNCWRWPQATWDDPWDITTPACVLDQIRAKIRRGESDEEQPEYRTCDPIVCPKCSANRISGPQCFVCGFQYDRRTRPVVQLDGSLVLESGPMYKQRKISRQLDDAERWKRAYWGAKKNSPHRTFEQVYSYFAFKNNWRWLPRNLPLMPVRDRHWFSAIGEIPFDQLRQKQPQE